MDNNPTYNLCPTCGNSNIQKVKKNWAGEYNGMKYRVLNLEYYECSDCGEKVYDREAMRRIEEKSPAFTKGRNKKVA